MAQLIYLDEAGHEATAPFTVVGGVMVDADLQLSKAELFVEEILRGIPAPLHGLGKISIKSIWGNPKYRTGWSKEGRLFLIRQLISAARKCRIPVAYSVIPRKHFQYREVTDNNIAAKMDHVMGLSTLTARIDLAIRHYRKPGEIGIIFYEDMQQDRERLNFAANLHRGNPMYFDPSMLIPDKSYEIGEMRVERLRKRVVFLRQEDEPLLLMADAVCFTVRRFLGHGQHGDEFMKELIGWEVNDLQMIRDEAMAGSFARMHFFG